MHLTQVENNEARIHRQEVSSEQSPFILPTQRVLSLSLSLSFFLSLSNLHQSMTG